MGQQEASSRTRVFLWNSIFSILNLLVALLSTIVLVPFYLRYIDKGVYGAWLASGNVISWLGMIDPGLSLVVQQKVAYAYGANDQEALGEWVGTSLLLNGVIAIILMLGGVGVAGYLPTLLNLPCDMPTGDLIVSFIWSVIGTAAFLFSFGAASINMGLQSRFGAGGIGAGAQIIRVVLIFVLLISGYGLVSIGLACAISGLVAMLGSCIYLCWRLRREGVRVRVSASGIRRLLGFLSYTSLLRVGHTLFQYMDLFFVARLLGAESVTILRLSRASVDMCSTFAQRPAATIQAPITHIIGEGGIAHARNVAVRFICIEVWLLAYIAGGLTIFNGPFVRLWVGTGFYGGDLLNVVLVIGFLANAFTMVLFNLCFAAGNIKKSSLVFMAQGCIYMVLLLLFAPRFGLIGAALASVFSFLAAPIWYFPLSFGSLYIAHRKEWGIVIEATAYAAAASVLAGICVHWTLIRTWTELWIVAFSYSLAFLFTLLLTSSAFRCEFATMVASIRRKLTF